MTKQALATGELRSDTSATHSRLRTCCVFANLFVIQKKEAKREKPRHHRKCTGIIRIGWCQKPLIFVVLKGSDRNLPRLFYAGVAQPVVADHKFEDAIHIRHFHSGGESPLHDNVVSAGVVMTRG